MSPAQRWGASAARSSPSRLLSVVLGVLVLLVPMSARSQVLFSDDFAGPRLAPLGYGAWRVTDGVLRSEHPSCCSAWPGAPANWIALGDPTWQAYQVDCDFRFTTQGGRLILGSHVDP